jgi:Glycosyltransferase
MKVLHVLDNSNRGGIQENIFRLYKNSKHEHGFWAADGSMAGEMRQAGMKLWNGAPPEEEKYEVMVGHTVGGWSYHDTSGWARSRDMKVVECMHSVCRSPTPPEDVDGFIALSDMALNVNRQMPNAIRIYGIVEVPENPKTGDSIGRLSRLVDEKRPQDFSIIANNFRKEKFILGGDGPMYDQLKQDSPMNMTMIGWVRDFPEFFSKLKLFVFPTRDECCCISVAMAQVCGIPCVVQDIPALRETTGGFALFAGGVPEFASRVQEYLNNPQSFEEMAENGRKWAVENFGVPGTVGAWDSYLETICPPKSYSATPLPV